MPWSVPDKLHCLLARLTGPQLLSLVVPSLSPRQWIGRWLILRHLLRIRLQA